MKDGVFLIYRPVVQYEESITPFEIVDCVRAHRSPWFCGEVGFVIANARPVPFTPARGMLNFYSVSEQWRAFGL